MQDDCFRRNKKTKKTLDSGSEAGMTKYKILQDPLYIQIKTKNKKYTKRKFKIKKVFRQNA